MELPPFPALAEAPAPLPASYEGYERPGMTIAYAIGPHGISKGIPVGLDDDGLLVPIDRAVCFVGMANESRRGEPKEDHRASVNVTVVGTFVFPFAGQPDRRDLQRAAWFIHGPVVGGAPAGLAIPAGRVVGIESTSDGRPGVRVKIDAATSRCLPPLPGRLESAEAWARR